VSVKLQCEVLNSLQVEQLDWQFIIAARLSPIEIRRRKHRSTGVTIASSIQTGSRSKAERQNQRQRPELQSKKPRRPLRPNE
jgi:hypothetical protein